MRKIGLGAGSIHLFDGELDCKVVLFFQKHTDAFKCMWHDQGKRFWKRFVQGFRTFCESILPEDAKAVDAFFQCGYSYIDAQYIDGRYSDAWRFIADIFIVAISKNYNGSFSGGPQEWEPFYGKETRVTFWKLFGPPGADTTFANMYILCPLYLRFVVAVCNCLKCWIEAEECDSSDESYWSQEFSWKHGMATDSILLGNPLHISKKKSTSKFSQEKANDDGPRKDLPTSQQAQFAQQNPTKTGTTTANSSTYTQRSNDTAETKNEDETLPAGNSSRGARKFQHATKNESRVPKFPSAKKLEALLRLKDPTDSDYHAVVEEDVVREAKQRNMTPKQILQQVIQDLMSKEDHVCWCFKDATECLCDNVSMFCQCAKDSAMRNCNKAKVALLLEELLGMHMFDEPSTASDGKPSSAKSDASTKQSGASVVAVFPTEHANKKAKNRICDNCKLVEPKPKTFKKCQRCYEEKLTEPKYYCGRECQVAAWKIHRQDHVPAKATLNQWALCIAATPGWEQLGVKIVL